MPGLYVVVICRNLAGDYSAAAILLPSKTRLEIISLPCCHSVISPSSVVKPLHPTLAPEEFSKEAAGSTAGSVSIPTARRTKTFRAAMKSVESPRVRVALLHQAHRQPVRAEHQMDAGAIRKLPQHRANPLHHRLNIQRVIIELPDGVYFRAALGRAVDALPLF